LRILLRLWKTKDEISFWRKKKNANSLIAAIPNLTGAFSAPFLFISSFSWF
jgi:hypothetical protein